MASTETKDADTVRRIEALPGTTLWTTAKQRPFDVVSVDERYVRVRASSGRVQTIPRADVEAGCALVRAGHELTLRSLENAVGASSPSYCLAIVKYVAAGAIAGPRDMTSAAASEAAELTLSLTD